MGKGLRGGGHSTKHTLTRGSRGSKVLGDRSTLTPKRDKGLETKGPRDQPEEEDRGDQGEHATRGPDPSSSVETNHFRLDRSPFLGDRSPFWPLDRHLRRLSKEHELGREWKLERFLGTKGQESSPPPGWSMLVTVSLQRCNFYLVSSDSLRLKRMSKRFS